jgi:hypothetical protein
MLVQARDVKKSSFHPAWANAGRGEVREHTDRVTDVSGGGQADVNATDADAGK